MTINLNNICPKLEKKEDGVWHSAFQESISYIEEESDRCFAIEEKSLWFQHRSACVRALLKKFPPLDNGAIFDIGGGNGFMAKEIVQGGFNAVLLEPSYKGVQNAVKRGIDDIICSSFESSEILDDSLCAVGLFDTLEHVENDQAFLKRIYSALKKNGNLYLTVPSYSFLWSHEDVIAGHKRRYTLTALKKILEPLGFSIDFSTYIFSPLPVFIFLSRVIPYRLHLAGKKQKCSDLTVHSRLQDSWLAKCGEKILSPEIFLIQKGFKNFFGGSCLLAARKK